MKPTYEQYRRAAFDNFKSDIRAGRMTMETATNLFQSACEHGALPDAVIKVLDQIAPETDKTTIDALMEVEAPKAATEQWNRLKRRNEELSKPKTKRRPTKMTIDI